MKDYGIGAIMADVNEDNRSGSAAVVQRVKNSLQKVAETINFPNLCYHPFQFSERKQCPITIHVQRLLPKQVDC